MKQIFLGGETVGYIKDGTPLMVIPATVETFAKLFVQEMRWLRRTKKETLDYVKEIIDDFYEHPGKTWSNSSKVL